MEIPDKQIRQYLLTAQKNEITEYLIYMRLARSMRDVHNHEVLERIAQEEKAHHDFYRHYTDQDVRPNRFKIWMYYFISKVFGLTFGIKLMEAGEGKAQQEYMKIADAVPEIQKVVADEDRHEHELIALINEERLEYIGSMVLGLNDALVELTGALAGLTFALQNTRLIAVVGLITGIAASLSMAASEYLSTKTEAAGKNAFKASVYTGVAYVFTVLFLIFPYLIIVNPYVALGLPMVNALIVIFLFTFYISVAKDFSFKHRFTEMSCLSFGVAVVSFLIGILIRHFLPMEV